jgi:hypothetical protein
MGRAPDAGIMPELIDRYPLESDMSLPSVHDCSLNRHGSKGFELCGSALWVPVDTDMSSKSLRRAAPLDHRRSALCDYGRWVFARSIA